jgi:8-oxo-dGTP pyrophosphatase MutT (NUDIX family)
MAVKTAVSAGAIILREIDGHLKIAMARHQRPEKAWILPKGHVEQGETLEQAALREIYEETGLRAVTLIKYLGSIPRESVKSNGDIVHKMVHFYLAYASDDHLQPTAPTDAKFTSVGWFSAHEAMQLFPYDSERAFFREHLPLLLT